MRVDLHNEFMLAGHYHPKFRTDLYNRLDRIDAKIRSNNWTSEFNSLCSRNQLVSLLPSLPISATIVEQFQILGVIGLIDEGTEAYAICSFARELKDKYSTNFEKHKENKESPMVPEVLMYTIDRIYDITEEWARADGEGWLVGTPIIQALLRPLPDT